MTRRSYRTGERWSIILAGGEGTRLSSLTIRRFGEHRPKQYCAFLGERTMFDHTLDRALAFSGPRRVVTVLGRGHMRFLRQDAPLYGQVIEQPANRETAPGIFLPLAYVLAHDADAVVSIFPSDHFISPKSLFIEYVDRAASVAEQACDKIVLAAAVADRPEPEYGWIQQGDCAVDDCDLRTVLQFHEKPDAALAARFHDQGFLWNTFNMSVKASTLWALGWRHEPEMMARFERLRDAVGTAREGRTLAEIYEGMPLVNFSKAILERAVTSTLVMPLTGVEWSDWGKPERIQETLERRRVALAPSRPAPQAAARLVPAL